MEKLWIETISEKEEVEAIKSKVKTQAQSHSL